MDYKNLGKLFLNAESFALSLDLWIRIKLQFLQSYTHLICYAESGR